MINKQQAMTLNEFFVPHYFATEEEAVEASR